MLVRLSQTELNKYLTETQNPNLISAFLDTETNEVFMFSNDMLTNTMNSGFPELQQEFDNSFLDKIKNIDSKFSLLLSLSLSYRDVCDEFEDNISVECGMIIENALSTFLSSFRLLRDGFPLQSAILIRSIVESCNTVLYIKTTPKNEGYSKFIENSYKSSKSITKIGKHIPFFDKFWGYLSNTYIHINKTHSNSYSILDADPSRQANSIKLLDLLDYSLFLLQIAIEANYLTILKHPNYVKLVDGSMHFEIEHNEYLRLQSLFAF